MNQSPTNHEEELQKAERIAYLIAGHIRGTLSEEESDELDEWITESDENLALFEKLTDEGNIEGAIEQYRNIERDKEAAYTAIKSKTRSSDSKWIALRPYLVATAVILVIAAGILLWFNNKPAAEKPIAQDYKQEELPAGRDQAVLSLSNGRTLILDGGGTGVLASEGNVDIEQTAEGEIRYKGTETEMKYNTLSTPRGGQYQIVLGDGTRVWLNAESYLKFPAAFHGNQRRVELRGEAYFEVAKDTVHPFIVSIGTPAGDAGSVEVLGTHFNINAYGDEATVKTSLLEGSVRISKDGVIKTLHPGQQAITGTSITVINTDVREAVAWKEGKFLFRDASIHSIGEQLKRWYDVEVEYRGSITQHFNTEASRNISLQKLLKGLEGTNEVEFVVEGRKLVIKPAKVLQ